MKKKTLTTLVLAVTVLCAAAQDKHIVERTFVATDRQCYVAGDYVWCSAFCFDITDGCRLSDFSSVAYVELLGAGGTAATCKVALDGGRGAARFKLPHNLPTGNYRIFAYTAVNRNEAGHDFLAGSRLLSVFNTLSGERNPEVALTDGPVESPAPCGSSASPVSISVKRGDGAASVSLANASADAAEFCVSVFCDDALVPADKGGMAAFLKACRRDASAFTAERIPEYDGEIIYARVPSSFHGKTAYVSSTGKESNVYTAEVDADGLATIVTGNVYGETDLIFELEDTDGAYDLEVDSPFISPDLSKTDFGRLMLSRTYADDLKRRSVAMQLTDIFGCEVLTERIPERPNLLFSGADMVSYRLDDYTRFPTIREVITEFVKEMNIRRDAKGDTVFHIILEDITGANKSLPVYSGESLMMIDGVPLLNHESLLSYDPSLVERIDIFRHPVAVGNRIFDGVANFVTYKKDLPGMKFADNVRVLGFHGVSYPTAFTAARIPEGYPDYRQTLYWNPLFTVGAGSEASFDVTLPAYDGKFRIRAEGVTGSGIPFVAEATL